MLRLIKHVVMCRYRKRKMHVNDKPLKKKYLTKRRTKDLDQIQEDLRDKNARKLTNQRAFEVA